MNTQRIITGVRDRVPPRCWYYVLDYNDRTDRRIMRELFNTECLSELTDKEFWYMFKLATKKDIKNWKQK